jgi:hypothetical protein
MSAKALGLPNCSASRVFHRTDIADQNQVILTANVYAGFIIEELCGRHIKDGDRVCDGKDIGLIPTSAIKQAVSGQHIIDASHAFMQKHTLEQLTGLRKELSDIMRQLQDDNKRMTQFEKWSMQDTSLTNEAYKRCFHSARQPKLQYTESLQKLSPSLKSFLNVGGVLHDVCAKNHFIPVGFIYQVWLDRIIFYMHYTTTKNNVVATTQESSVMATRSPDVRILDLRKQKDAVIYLSREQTTGDDMPFYETKFKQELDAYMATQQLTTEQDKVEVRQIWLSGKFDSIAEKMKQLRTGH